MPAATQPRTRRFAAAAALLAGLVTLSAGQAPPPKDKTDAGAFRLPDGTVVFFTKNPDDPDPKIDGVLLTPKEYQALLDKAEQLKKAKEAAKPSSPSECHVRGRVETKGGRAVAVLKLAFAFRTTAPRTAVALGGQRAFLAAAAGGDGKLPLLAASDDGLTVVADAPGEHRLTLDVEAPVGPRGGKGEVGFEFGLPRAAITTLALDPPGVKKLTVTTRSTDPPAGPGKAGDVKRTTEDAARFAAKPGENGPPLGPVESLEVTWEAPAAAAPAAAETPVSVEADVAVRVEDARVETTAKLRLRGPPRDWAFVFPPSATVSVERAGSAAPGAADAVPTVTRPADSKGTAWSIRTPDGGEWVATVTVRRDRPDPKDAKFPGPYPVGPFFAQGAPRQSGVVRVFAPPTIRVRYTPQREVRLQDAPTGVAEDAPVLAFRYAAPPAKDGKPLPLLDLDARPARGLVLVQPSHKLRLTEAGWRLRTDLKVTPVRTEVEAVTVELPPGWETLDALPPDLVEEVRPAGNQRFTVRLAAPRKGPFDLVLEATWRVKPADKEASIPLPRFPDAVERGAQVAAAVPDGFEVRGSAREWDGKQPAAFPTELTPAAAPAGAAVTTVSGTCDAGAARVDVSWSPHRPELSAQVATDVTLYERQAEVAQTVKLSAAAGLPGSVRFTGPPAPAGFRSPLLAPAGPKEWTFAPRAGEKEATVTLRYAVPLTPGPGGVVPVPLVWPEATRVETTVRVWAGGGHRVARFDGPWQERPPEPDKDRDALPALTLTGGGAGLPLGLELAAEAAPVVIDRGAVQVVAADDGTALVRGRYVLRRWTSAGVEVELPAGATAVVLVDRRKVEAPAAADVADRRVIRVPLPEPKPSRPTVELEVRYSPPPARPGFGELVLDPPAVRGAVVRAPLRWQVVAPSGSVAPVADPAFTPDVRWQWRDWRFVPGPAWTPADLDAWLAGGSDPGAADEAAAWAPPNGEVVAGRLPAGDRLRVVRGPRVGWVFLCSGLVFVAGVVAARLRPRLLGPAVAVLGAAAAAGAVAVPQAAGQFAAAAQPGVAVLVLALAAQAGRRWYHRHKVTHLPTFARGPSAEVTGSEQTARSSRNGAADGGRTGSSIPPLSPAGSN